MDGWGGEWWGRNKGDELPEASLYQSQDLALQQRLSPQMRQSLEILQATALELRQLLRQELETNPTLEDESESASLDER